MKSADVTSAEVGDTVTYTFTVSHATRSDGTPVSAITVIDDIAGAATLDTQTGGDTDTLLETGETWTYTATYTVLATDPDPLVNTVTVEGTDEDNDPVTATDNHSLPIGAPIIEVVKTADVMSAEVGDTVIYTFTVSHASSSDGTPVSAITVDDDIAGAATLDTQTGGDTDPLLETGETWTYTATYTVLATDPDPLVNTVTVEGTDEDNDPVTATDNHSLPIGAPVIEVVKTADVNVRRSRRHRHVHVHRLPRFSSDGTPVSAITVIDDIAGAATLDTQTGGDTDPLLEAGETWTYTATYTVLATDPDPLVNTVTVEGTDEDGDPVTATDNHSLPIGAPVIQVVKTADVMIRRSRRRPLRTRSPSPTRHLRQHTGVRDHRRR